MENKPRNQEEVDVFELFGYIGRGFNKIGDAFLRFFNFLMRNIILLGCLILIGVVAGYFVDKATPEKRKTVAIVVSNFGSTEYLYKSIEEMEAELKTLTPELLKKIGLTDKEAGSLSLEIKPIISVREVSPEEKTYLEFLEDNPALEEEEKQLILDKSYQHHQITLFHPATFEGQKILTQIIDQIRQNPHFQKVHSVSAENLKRQIKSNLFVLAQIDTLFQNYSKNIGNAGALGENTMYSNSLNLGELLEMRMEFQQKTQALIIENVENTGFLKITDMGSPQKPKDIAFTSNKIVFYPLALLGLFFLVHLVIRIGKKAKKIN